MLYIWLKLIHILSSTILFGTGIGTASVMLYGHYTKNPYIIAAITKYVVIADWIFTTPAIFIQPITGLYMVWLAGYSLSSLWLITSMIGYLIALICWLPVVYLQIKLRDLANITYLYKKTLPAIYYKLFRYWFILGWPALFSFLMIFYLMTFKPL